MAIILRDILSAFSFVSSSILLMVLAESSFASFSIFCIRSFLASEEVMPDIFSRRLFCSSSAAVYFSSISLTLFSCGSSAFSRFATEISFWSSRFTFFSRFSSFWLRRFSIFCISYFLFLDSFSNSAFDL